MNDLLNEIAWNENGLVPAIAQDHKTGQVLMLAWWYCLPYRPGTLLFPTTIRHRLAKCRTRGERSKRNLCEKAIIGAKRMQARRHK